MKAVLNIAIKNLITKIVLFIAMKTVMRKSVVCIAMKSYDNENHYFPLVMTRSETGSMKLSSQTHTTCFCQNMRIFRLPLPSKPPTKNKVMPKSNLNFFCLISVMNDWLGWYPCSWPGYIFLPAFTGGRK